MRIARKLTLLVMLALAATALTAPSAYAQTTEPEFHNQAPRLIVQQENHNALDVNCPAVVPTPPVAVSPTVTSGGCRVHVASVGEVALLVHLVAGGTELVVSSCSIEFDGRMDSAGEGWTSHHEFTGPPTTCTRKTCGQVTPPTSEGRAYSYHIRETEPAPREMVTTLFCTESITPGNDPSHCEITAPGSVAATHRFQGTLTDTSGHGVFFPHCELTGTLLIETAVGNSGEGEARQNIEIRHS